MLNRILADLLVILHLGFIVFVVLGGFLVLRWPRVMWIHIPAALWGAAIEFWGWICPLTPLEWRLREAAGQDSYVTSFIEHYIVPLVYPSELTRAHQLGLGSLVIVLNIVAYTLVWRRRRLAIAAEEGGR